MDVLAIIPARGGSKSVPRKNLRQLAGRPLVGHAIDHALRSKLVRRVVVSTDDEEIAAVAREAGACVVRRPADLSGDRSPTLPALLHALRELDDGDVPDAVVTLQPTSPLRRPAQIDEAIRLLEPEWDSVVGVCEAEHTPYKMFRIDGETLTPFVVEHGQGVPRQSLPPVYRENGAIYVTWRRTLEAGSIWGDRPRVYVMDRRTSIDIDSEIDLRLAELLLREGGVGESEEA